MSYYEDKEAELERLIEKIGYCAEELADAYCERDEEKKHKILEQVRLYLEEKDELYEEVRVLRLIESCKRAEISKD